MTEGRQTKATRDIHHIAHHRARRRAHTRAGAAQHDLVNIVTLEHDHIGAALQLAKGARIGHEAGRHALFQAAPGHLRHT